MDRKKAIGLSWVLLFLIAYVDSTFFEVSLGVLYIIPVLILAGVLNRWQVVAVALLCAILRQLFLSAIDPWDAALRFIMAFIAYTAGGLLLVEMASNRRRAMEHASQLEQQAKLRREAEEHLRALAESSPAAIFTTDDNGEILTWNQATLELLGAETKPPHLGIGDHLPVLRDALKLQARGSGFRTAAQCTGRRLNGDPFIAQVWFSIYSEAGGRRLAAIAMDVSEDVREREERNLQQVLDNNRIIAGAVSHEIRNVCGAIAMVYSNLQRDVSRYGALESAEDFRAMGGLVEGLTKIASSDLQTKSRRSLTPIQLESVLADFRVVAESSWNDIEGRILWTVPPNVPPVFAEPFGLTQALLNLSQNSQRAVQDLDQREMYIRVHVKGRQVVIQMSDSGPGIQNPQQLFEPFQRGSEHIGLGLYVSRALLRSYGGDLRHEVSDDGSWCFAAYLNAAAQDLRESTERNSPNKETMVFQYDR